MMNISQFNISLKDTLSFAKDLSIYKDVGKKPIGQYSAELKKVSKRNRHKDTYDCAIKNLDYELMLKDDSIFQFGFSESEIRYAFIQNPMIFLNKEEYLEHIFTKEELLQMTDSELEETVNDISDEEYEQFLNEQGMNISANNIRYDATLLGYSPLLHSYSHIHIGNNQDLRIPICKILTPLKFFKFCIKNSYYSLWKEELQKNGSFKEKIRIAKSKCTSLNSSKWQEIEKYELYLT